MDAVARLGAKGYVLKNTVPEELATAIETVHRGGAYFSPDIAKILLKNKHGDSAGQKDGVEVLTPRELEVLKLVAEGLRNKEMAAQLKISTRTVETHRQNLMKKLGIHSTAELLRFALFNSPSTPES